MLKIKYIKIVFLLLLSGTLSVNAQRKADKPLFRDPVYDGAADPSVIYNKAEAKWFMFYTNRRANANIPGGVKWVHGTPIGIAESSDGGATWTYRDTCNIDYHPTEHSYWAPDVLEFEGIYHMFLTYVPGIFEDWNHERYIIHLTSKNLLDWKFESRLDLASDRCIDGSICRLPNGNWRLFYNNERDGKSMYYADSPDLYHWTDSGKKVVGDKGGEGPKVFHWKGKYWMIVDNWQGLGVYYSDDMKNWKRQPESILQVPGKGEDDMDMGRHADVVISDDKAYIFYFTHPGRIPENKGKNSTETRRSSIQVAELKFENGIITCDREQAVYINLIPPK